MLVSTKLLTLVVALLTWLKLKLVWDTLVVLGDPLAKFLFGVIELELVLIIFVVELVCIVWFTVVADTEFIHRGNAKL